MKLYRILHKPTGLYYQNSKRWEISSLGPKGKIYKRYIDVNPDYMNDPKNIMSLSITNGLYKKIKDVLDSCGYKKERCIRSPHLQEIGIDRFDTWIYYAPVTDFEIIEKDI